MAACPRSIALASLGGALALAQGVVAERLAPGYAQLLGLPSEPEISSATYEIAGEGLPSTVRVMRFPYALPTRDLGGGWSLRGHLSAGYLKMTAVFEAHPGTIASRWRTFSATGGLGLARALGAGWSATLGLEGGLARLDNHAVFAGGAERLQSSTEGLLFDWQVPAWLLTPSLGFDLRRGLGSGRFQGSLRASRSTIATFHAPTPALRFREHANAFSAAGEWVAPTGWHLAGAPVEGLVLAGTSGFFGGHRDALGFTSVSEVGAGLQVRLPGGLGKLGRVRLSGSWLVGPGLRGWTLGVGTGG